MNLSKSRFCKGVQCPKMLWLDRNMPEQMDSSVVNEELLAVGNVIGDLARGYFGGFAEVAFCKNKVEMLAETQLLLDEGASVIAEASFSYDGNFCSVDLLRAIPGGYELVEVKGSTASPSESAKKVKRIFIHDLAYQYYVLTNCGLNVKKASVMQLNREYVRKGELDIQQLFVLTDCTELVAFLQQDMAEHIGEIKATATQESEPAAEISSRCNNPYTCGYKAWCYRHLPPNNVFDIGWRMRNATKDAAYRAGFLSFEDVLRNGVKLSESQHRQVTTVTQNLPPHIDKAAIANFLAGIRYPLYHLDFETFQQAIPQWDNVSPYAQIAFQYSIHIQDAPCSEFAHKEFLGTEGIDPRRALAERLCADIPVGACVISYNMGFEKSCINRLIQLFPDLAGYLASINDNMIDLAVPFANGAYYQREMGSSYSIKAVLPALCPGDPELDYNALHLVKNGNEAMAAYATLHEKPPEEASEIRKALLAYCRLDTLAMVKLLDRLYEIAQQSC